MALGTSVLACMSVLACGGTAAVAGDGGGGQGAAVGEGGGAGAGGAAGGGPGGGPSCALDPPGPPFTFEIRNVGTRELSLAYGCGKSVPIELETPAGKLGIGPGNAGPCEVSCEEVYDGYANWGCSDCGPGVAAPLSPGGKVSIGWDRRVYAPHVAPAVCSGHAEQNDCALGTRVDEAKVASGVLAVCTTPEIVGFNGHCTDQDLFPFTLDWKEELVVIEVK